MIVLAALFISLASCLGCTEQQRKQQQQKESISLEEHLLHGLLHAGNFPQANIRQEPWHQDIQGLGISLFNSQGESISAAFLANDIPSIQQQLQDIIPQFPKNHNSTQSRILLDFILTIGEAGKLLDGFDPGITGIVTLRGEELYSWFLPGETISKGCFSNGMPKKDRIRDIMAGRVNSPWKDGNRTVHPFKSKSFVQDTMGSTTLLPVFRGNVLHQGELSQDKIRQVCIAAGEYFIQSIDETGKFVYNYYPLEDRISNKGYNNLRHCGSLFSIFQLYGTHKNPQLLAAGQRALEYILTFVPEKEAGYDFRYLLDQPLKNGYQKIKLGGAGLLLLALCEYQKNTGDEQYLHIAADLVAFIQSMQKNDGDYFARYNKTKRAGDPESFSIYYPGEAALALAYYYRLTGDEAALESAHKALLFLCSDEHKNHPKYRAITNNTFYPDVLIDSWRMMGYWEVFQLTGDMTLAEECLLLAQGMIDHQYTNGIGAAEDFIGGPMYPWPKVIAAGSRKEGLSHAWYVARKLKREPIANAIFKALQESARFCINQQYRPENSYFLPTNSKALGGIRNQIHTNVIRNDSVQHNLSGMLYLLHIMKERE